MFSQLGPMETSVDRAAREIVTAIVGGQLPSGDRLPPERDLADRFGINRGTLRSALHRIGAWGLVQARQGSGHQVLDFKRHAGPAILGVWLKSLPAGPDREAVFEDLLRIRRALATVVLSRLIDRADLDLGGVKGAIDSFEECIEQGQDLENVAEADLKVIGQIVDASGSLVFRFFLNPIASVVDTFENLRSAIYRNPEENLQAYRALLHGLKNEQSDLVEMADKLLEARDLATMQAWKTTSKLESVK